jgi:hypothetical protein
MALHALIGRHILKDCLAAVVSVGCGLRIGNGWRHTTLNPFACLDVLVLDECEAIPAVAGVVTHLIFAGASLTALMTLTIIDVSTDELLTSLGVSDCLDLVAIETVTCVVHVLITAHTKGSTGVSDAVVDWQARADITIHAIWPALHIPRRRILHGGVLLDEA